VRDRQWDETAPVVMLQDLSRVLFEEEGFRGNRDEYYDPRNSFLNDVLDRRSASPSRSASSTSRSAGGSACRCTA
jgi:regulator of sirC expression with transglutaminase-like and TPR domain